MKKMMIATAAILVVAGWVLAQESPLLEAAHVYTNTTPLESITYDTGSAVTSKIADIKYAIKVEELSSEGGMGGYRSGALHGPGVYLYHKPSAGKC